MKSGVKTYLGIMTHSYPNLFGLLGPNTGLGHNSIIVMIEAQCNWILQCIEKMMLNNWKEIDIKKDVQQKWNVKLQKQLKRMVWDDKERSWYKSEKGDIDTLYGWTTLYYMWETWKPNFNQFIVKLP